MKQAKKNYLVDILLDSLLSEEVLVSDEDATARSGWSVIVEGEIDKLALWEAGIKNCISVPDGAPPPNSRDYSSKFEYLNGNWTKGIGKFILAVDNDEAGKKLEDDVQKISQSLLSFGF